MDRAQGNIIRDALGRMEDELIGIRFLLREIDAHDIRMRTRLRTAIVAVRELRDAVTNDMTPLTIGYSHGDQITVHSEKYTITNILSRKNGISLTLSK